MSIWERGAKQRISRRGALTGLGVAGAGAALFAACGGKEASKDDTGLLSKPADRTSQAKPGGTLRHFSDRADQTMDSLAGDAAGTAFLVIGYGYPRMLKHKPSIYPNPAGPEVEPELAQSYEFSPDRLQVTFKLRRGMKWDHRPPTNGRDIDSDDVLFSWGKLNRLSPYAAQIAYSATSPSAPVESLTAPDPYTIVARLKRPDPATEALFALDRLYFMPRESDGGFNPRSEMRGHGPYFLDKYTPSVGYTWKKNPNYYLKDRPFVDAIEMPIILEYATRLAQFRAGAIYTSVASVQDIVQTKNDVPATVLQQGISFPLGFSSFIAWGYEGDSQFKDLRVRQAMSYLIDRDSYADLLTNRDKFAASGINVDIRMPTVIGSGWDGFWVDPQNEKAFGQNAKYYRYNPPEAKRLLAAAGLPGGFATTFYYSAGRVRLVEEIIPQQLREGGINVKAEPVDPNTGYVPGILRQYVGGKSSGGQGSNGVRFNNLPTAASIDLTIEQNYHPSGRNFVGLSPDGRNAFGGDSEINALIEKMRQEFDTKKQQALSLEFQQKMAERAYVIPTHVESPSFTLSWPAVANYGVYVPGLGGVASSEADIHRWLDQNKPPLKAG